MLPHRIKSLALHIEKKEADITKGFTAQQMRLWDVFIFLLKFLILALPLHFIIWANLEFESIILVTSYATDFVLRFLTQDFVRNGALFIIGTPEGTAGIEIIKDCIGWKSFMALAGLIFATRRARLKPRIIGFLIGIPAIFIGNIIRLVTTIFVTIKYGPAMFEITHTFLWQWGLVMLVLLLWLLWLKKIAFNPKYF